MTEKGVQANISLIAEKLKQKVNKNVDVAIEASLSDNDLPK